MKLITKLVRARINKRHIRPLIYWTGVICWMFVIFNLSSQVAEESDKISKDVTKIIVNAIESITHSGNFNISKLNHIVRKNAHFFIYLVLGMLLTNAMRRRDRNCIRRVILIFLICVIYAISDEIHQIFVAGRGPGLKDVFIDSVGAMFGIWIYLALDRIKRKVMTRTL